MAGCAPDDLLAAFAQTAVPDWVRARAPGDWLASGLALSEDPRCAAAWAALTETQRQSLAYCRRRAAVWDFKAREWASGRAPASEISEVLTWLRAAPITINVQLARDFAHFARDGRYRSLFEVLRSGGCCDLNQRARWERNVLGPAYGSGYVPPGSRAPPDACAPAERPKYGALNWGRCAAGAAPRYGPSFFTLAEHVKTRATFTYGDSSSKSHLGLGTTDAMGKPMVDLWAHFPLLLKAARGAAALPPQYLEAQIHGELLFARDVERLTVSPIDAPPGSALAAQIAQQCAVWGVAVEWLPA